MTRVTFYSVAQAGTDLHIQESETLFCVMSSCKVLDETVIHLTAFGAAQPSDSCCIYFLRIDERCVMMLPLWWRHTPPLPSPIIFWVFL